MCRRPRSRPSTALGPAPEFGALVGLGFPLALIGSAVVVVGAGGLIGHLRSRVARSDLKDLGDELESGTAAVS